MTRSVVGCCVCPRTHATLPACRPQLLYLGCSGSIVYFMRYKHPWSSTYETPTKESDKFPHLKFAVAPCAALAFVRAVCSELRALCSVQCAVAVRDSSRVYRLFGVSFCAAVRRAAGDGHPGERKKHGRAAHVYVVCTVCVRVCVMSDRVCVREQLINQGTIYDHDSVTLGSLISYLVQVCGQPPLWRGRTGARRPPPFKRALPLPGWPLQVCWAFSIYLEAVAILPQLIVLQKEQVVESLTGHYVACLGSYRALYIINWIYKAMKYPGCVRGPCRATPCARPLPPSPLPALERRACV